MVYGNAFSYSLDSPAVLSVSRDTVLSGSRQPARSSAGRPCCACSRHEHRGIITVGYAAEAAMHTCRRFAHDSGVVRRPDRCCAFGESVTS
jgi:hypothetical protein